MQVHRLIAEGTLEDRVAALLEKKRDLAEAVIGSGERWIAELSDAELTELVSLPGRVVTAARATAPGHTRWGRSWLDALEQRAKLDPNRLPRGQDYARTGAVGDLVFAPGEARARVQGRRSQPYETRIRVRQFTEQEWDRVLDSVSAQLGRAAALLDGELPPEVADDVTAAGLDLLPGPGEVGPRCNCPDDADPCKHAAAVCYLVAGALDADPFALLLLRGRTRGEVLSGLRNRPGAAARGRSHRPARPPAPPPEGARLSVTRAWTPGLSSPPCRDRGRFRSRCCRPSGRGIRRRCRSIPQPRGADCARTCWRWPPMLRHVPGNWRSG